MIVLDCVVVTGGQRDVTPTLVVHPSVTVGIGFADHVVDLLVAQILAQGDHDLPNLGWGDVTVVVLVEDLESLQHVIAGLVHLGPDHLHEFLEVHRAATCTPPAT